MLKSSSYCSNHITPTANKTLFPIKKISNERLKLRESLLILAICWSKHFWGFISIFCYCLSVEICEVLWSVFCSLPEAVQAKDKTFPHNTGIHFKGLKMKHFDILSVLTGVCVCIHVCVCVCVGKFACVHYQDFKLFLKSSHWKKIYFFILQELILWKPYLKYCKLLECAV